jgi:hypothetical protein
VSRAARSHQRVQPRRCSNCPTLPDRHEAVELFVRREDAERFIEEVNNDEPELASFLRIEECELEAGGLTCLTGDSVNRQ